LDAYGDLLKGVEKRAVVVFSGLAELQTDQFIEFRLAVIKKEPVVDLPPFGVAFQRLQKHLILLFQSHQRALYD
jgi:hypothetical protein